MLCTALLLGTTFAWFTDSVTNTGNVITAGTLSIGASAYDVDTSKDTYQFAGINNGQAFGFKGDGQDLKAENCPPILSEPRWEPGVSNAKLLTVSNNGSLAANIRLSFDVEDNGLQDALWFDFIQVEPVQGSFVKRPMSELNTLAQSMVVPLNGGESVSFILVYGMDEQADNAFQGKSFSADVTVMATQASKEEDGFGSSDYDAAADGTPDHPEWATGGTAQVTKPAFLASSTARERLTTCVMGRRSSAPAAERRAPGPRKALLCLGRMSPAPPMAKSVRASVPTLPGSCT